MSAMGSSGYVVPPPSETTLGSEKEALDLSFHRSVVL